MPHTTIAAVSALKIRFPKLISIALLFFKKSTSSCVIPPSGPIIYKIFLSFCFIISDKDFDSLLFSYAKIILSYFLQVKFQ